MSGRHAFPRLRWIGLLWLAVYVPSYTLAYGVRNFLFLCNLGVFLTALGLWTGNRLLLSSQALSAPVIGLAWGLDAGWRLATGAHLFGGTEYMWDPQYPLFTRLFSLYHLAWPLLVVACARRAGYERKGYPLQLAIAAAGLVAGRALGTPAENINFAYRDPLLGLAFEPAALHLAAIWLGLAGVVYLVPHVLLGGARLPKLSRVPTVSVDWEA